jgi:hypothetical protein
MAARDVIPIFIASPGDVRVEREVAQEVVARVNKDLTSKFDLYLDLYGWEEQPPGFGRPQGQINPQVEEAELFIGLLWRSWGTPPGEGHTSGFEEEFALACDRRKDGELPEVWLFFRDVEAGQLKDPGKELKKVLAFRKRVERERIALYHTYEDEAHWGDKLYSLLVQYVATRVAKAESDEPARSPASSDSDSDAAPPAAEDGGAGASTVQRLQALDNVKAALTEDSSRRPDLLDATRLLIASFTWVSSRTLEVLGTHEQNLIYALRAELDLTVDERIQLVRSMLLGEGVRPGWYWLSEIGPSSPGVVFGYLASTDDNALVRRRALEAIPDPSFLDGWPEEEPVKAATFLRSRLGDKDVHVRGAALGLLARWGTDEALHMLQEASEDPKTKDQAEVSLARLLLKRSPDEALAMAVEDRVVSYYLEDEILAAAGSFSEEALEPLRTHEFSSMRTLALRLDSASGRASEEVTRAALTDKARDVQGFALDLMFERGWGVDEKLFQDLVSHFLLPSKRRRRWRKAHAKTRSAESLRAGLNWYYAWSDSTYAALAEDRFEEFGDQVRRDLADEFEQFQAESLKLLHSKFAEEEVREFLDVAVGAEKDDRTRDFIIAALGGIQRHRNEDDSELVIRYVEHSDHRVQVAAVKALRGIGDESAGRFAREVALHPDATDETARLALDIDAGSAWKLSESADSKVLVLAVERFTNDAQHRGRLREFLDSEKDDVRMAAVKRLTDILDSDELATLLDEYTKQDRYYYNVVTWLDCLVHAPEPFRAAHLSSLQSS